MYYLKKIENFFLNSNEPIFNVFHDEEGEPRKVVGCGCVVLKDWPVTAGDAVEQFKAAL